MRASDPQELNGLEHLAAIAMNIEGKIGAVVMVILLLCCSSPFRRDSIADDLSIADLAGTSWFRDEDARTAIDDEPRWTLRLEAEGQVDGRAGCNRFFGLVKISGRSISF